MKRIASILMTMVLMTLTCIYANAAGPQTPADDNSIRPGMKPEKLTVIDFNATWCGPCRMFAPAFDKASEELSDQAVFLSVDVDKYRETAQAFGVKAIPTIVIIRPDGETLTYVGLDDFMGDFDDEPTREEVIESIETNFINTVALQALTCK